jgi:site-specific DNA-methyltransferase (adenine-specific)
MLVSGRQPAFASGSKDFTLYQGDSLALLEEVPAESIDMVFADPPYFLSNGGVTCKSGRMVSVNKGEWDRSHGVDADFRFHMKWLSQCQRVLRPNGTIWVSGTRHVIYAVGFAMQTLGFKLLNDIVWHKRNPPPNLCCRYFTHATETILWAGRDESTRHVFDYRLMKSMNHGKQMQSVWSLMAPRGAEKVHGSHPTQKPLELLERIVLASTRPDDVVLDPFSGSGTTGIAAIRNGRRYVGMELEDQYIDLAARRYVAEKVPGTIAAAGELAVPPQIAPN